MQNRMTLCPWADCDEVIPFPYVDCEALGVAIGELGRGLTGVADALKEAATRAKAAKTRKAPRKRRPAKRAPQRASDKP